MEFNYPCGKDAVEAVLPHRDPFVWVTRVVACEPGVEIHAQLDVDPDLALFKGHFPEHPVLPGVIIMEALAQAASFCLLVDRGAEGALGFLTGIDKAKFRRQVVPGDVLDLEVEIIAQRGPVGVGKAIASVEGKRAVTCEIKFAVEQ